MESKNRLTNVLRLWFFLTFASCLIFPFIKEPGWLIGVLWAIPTGTIVAVFLVFSGKGFSFMEKHERKKFIIALKKCEKVIGPPDKSTWATDEEVEDAWISCKKATEGRA